MAGAVAAAPVVQAKSTEIAYTIGTVLMFGVVCMFVFPIVGKSLGMGYIQFGALAGTTATANASARPLRRNSVDRLGCMSEPVVP